MSQLVYYLKFFIFFYLKKCNRGFHFVPIPIIVLAICLLVTSIKWILLYLLLNCEKITLI